MTIDELSENFELFDEWEDRYRYVIDLGRALQDFLGRQVVEPADLIVGPEVPPVRSRRAVLPARVHRFSLW